MVRIVLTGDADLNSAIAAVNGNVFRFLTKPCPPDQLLATVQASIEHHRMVSAERTLVEVARPNAGSATSRSTSCETDPCTGLPNRKEAEAALREALDETDDATKRKYAALFCIHKLDSIKLKFGHRIRDSVLLVIAQHLATRLVGASDQIYRWSQACFVAILEREDEVQFVSREVNRVLEPMNASGHLFESSDSSVFLPLRLTGEVFEISGRSVAQICEDLDRWGFRRQYSRVLNFENDHTG